MDEKQRQELQDKLNTADALTDQIKKYHEAAETLKLAVGEIRLDNTGLILGVQARHCIGGGAVNSLKQVMVNELARMRDEAKKNLAAL